MSMKHYVNNEELFQIQYEGLMRLVKAIVFQILDYVSISKKWNNKDVSLKTLLNKKKRLQNEFRYLNSEKFIIILTIFCERFGGEIKVIKRNFLKIRLKSIKIVNKKIYENKNKDK